MPDQDHFPVLSLHEFSQGKSSDSKIIFNELHGARNIESPHKHDFFIIVLFEKGSGIHEIDFTAYNIAKHQLHLVLPGQVHQWRINKSTRALQLMIGRQHFELLVPFLRHSVSFYQRHIVIDLSASDFRFLQEEFLNVQHELGQAIVFDELVINRCRSIALLISRVSEKVFDDLGTWQSDPVLLQFMTLLDANFREQRTVTWYAAKVGITANYLNMVCKKRLRVPASSLIHERVVLEAKRLLKASGMSIKEIMYDLGFDDQANFAKFFRTHTGMSPSVFQAL